MHMRFTHSHAPLPTMLLASAAIILSVAFGNFQERATAASSGDTTWTVYHGNAIGSGVSTALKSVTTARRAWSSPVLSGELYGEPLVFSNDVFVATENDTVYALTSSRG